jgi:hypothetical protein
MVPDPKRKHDLLSQKPIHKCYKSQKTTEGPCIERVRFPRVHQVTRVILMGRYTAPQNCLAFPASVTQACLWDLPKLCVRTPHLKDAIPDS